MAFKESRLRLSRNSPQRKWEGLYSKSRMCFNNDFSLLLFVWHRCCLQPSVDGRVGPSDRKDETAFAKLLQITFVSIPFYHPIQNPNTPLCCIVSQFSLAIFKWARSIVEGYRFHHCAHTQQSGLCRKKTDCFDQLSACLGNIYTSPKGELPKDTQLPDTQPNLLAVGCTEALVLDKD